MSKESWATVAVAIAGMLGTVVAGYIGYASGAEAVEKDYVQIAISKLDDKNASPELRKWSVDVLNKLSPVPFGKKLEDELSASGFGRVYMMKIDVPETLHAECPDILKQEWERKEWVQGKKIVDLMEQYQVCRAKAHYLNGLISQTNALADKTNREQGLGNDQVPTANASQPAP